MVCITAIPCKNLITTLSMFTGVYPQQPRHYSPNSPLSPPFPFSIPLFSRPSSLPLP